MGDPVRQAPPRRRGASALAAALLAGVESIALDLRRDAARAVLDRLLERADVLLESSRPERARAAHRARARGEGAAASAAGGLLDLGLGPARPAPAAHRPRPGLPGAGRLAGAGGRHAGAAGGRPAGRLERRDGDPGGAGRARPHRPGRGHRRAAARRRRARQPDGLGGGGRGRGDTGGARRRRAARPDRRLPLLQRLRRRRWRTRRHGLSRAGLLEALLQARWPARSRRPAVPAGCREPPARGRADRRPDRAASGRSCSPTTTCRPSRCCRPPRAGRIRRCASGTWCGTAPTACRGWPIRRSSTASGRARPSGCAKLGEHTDAILAELDCPEATLGPRPAAPPASAAAAL